jgi:hypothetical protein
MGGWAFGSGVTLVKGGRDGKFHGAGPAVGRHWR